MNIYEIIFILSTFWVGPFWFAMLLQPKSDKTKKLLAKPLFFFGPIVLWFIVMIIYSYRVFSKKRYTYDYISLLFLLLLAFLLPPIITFSIYFCFFHSPRHIKLTLKEIPFMDKRRSFYEASSYSLIAILGMLYFYNYILGHYTNSERSLLIIFIGQ